MMRYTNLIFTLRVFLVKEICSFRVHRRYTMESLTSDVTSVRSKVKAVSDQLKSCKDAAFNSGVKAFLQVRLLLSV